MGTPILLLMLSWLTLNIGSTTGIATGREILISWSKNGVQQYTLNSPLQVYLGDNLFLECMPGSYNNAYYLVNQAQYNNCDGSFGTYVILGSCRKQANTTKQNITITVTQSSDPTLGDLQFQPNEMYYIASFSNGTSLLDAIGASTSGGQCTDGLKMAIQVLVRDNSTVPTDGIITTPANIGKTDIIIIIVVSVTTGLGLCLVLCSVLICCVCVRYRKNRKCSIAVSEKGNQYHNHPDSDKGTVPSKREVNKTSSLQKTKNGERKNGLELVKKGEQNKSDKKVISGNKTSKNNCDKPKNANSSKTSEVMNNVQESSTTSNPPRNSISPQNNRATTKNNAVSQNVSPSRPAPLVPPNRSKTNERNLRERNGSSQQRNGSVSVPKNATSGNNDSSELKKGSSRLPPPPPPTNSGKPVNIRQNSQPAPSRSSRSTLQPVKNVNPVSSLPVSGNVNKAKRALLQGEQ